MEDNIPATVPSAAAQTHASDARSTSHGSQQHDTGSSRVDHLPTDISILSGLPSVVYEQYPRAREQPELFVQSFQLLKAIQARCGGDSPASIRCHNILCEWGKGLVLTNEVHKVFKVELSAHGDLWAEYKRISRYSGHSYESPQPIEPELYPQSVPTVMQIPHQPSLPTLPAGWGYGQYLPPPNSSGAYDEMSSVRRPPDHNLQSPDPIYQDNFTGRAYGHQMLQPAYHNNYNPAISASSFTQMYPQMPATPTLNNHTQGYQVVPGQEGSVQMEDTPSITGQDYGSQLSSPYDATQDPVRRSIPYDTPTSPGNNVSFMNSCAAVPSLGLGNNVPHAPHKSEPRTPSVIQPSPEPLSQKDQDSTKSQIATPEAGIGKSKSSVEPSTRNSTPDQPKKRRPLGTGDFVHMLCGKHFTTRSGVKKHHFGGKETASPSTGCWKKHKFPPRAWDEHPSCQEGGGKSQKTRISDQSQEQEESAQTGAAPIVPNMIPPLANLNPLPSFPTFEHLPQQVLQTVSDTQGFNMSSVPGLSPLPGAYSSHAQRLPFGSPQASRLDALASAASTLSGETPIDTQHDSIVSRLEAQVAAIMMKSQQESSWPSNQQDQATASPCNPQQASGGEATSFPSNSIQPMQDDQPYVDSEPAVVQSEETDVAEAVQDQQGSQNEGPRRRDPRRGETRSSISKRELKMLGVIEDEGAPDKKKPRRENSRKARPKNENGAGPKE